MYAVIETGGKQYRVELGSVLELDRFDAEPGSSIELGRVLLVADGDDAQIGRPVVDGARVTADVMGQDRGEKIDVFKYQPKARRRVKKGHRSELTVVRISDIVFDGRSAAEQASAAARDDEAARAAAEKEAARKAAADQALAAKLAAEQAAMESAEKEAKAKKPTTRAAGPKAKSAAAPRSTTEPKKKPASRGTSTDTAKRAAKPSPRSKTKDE